MKQHYLKMIMISTIVFLSGCSLAEKKSNDLETPDAVVNKNIELAISTIQNTQAELYQYGAINEKVTGITGSIYHDNVRIDMNWNGDAYELLAQMAKQRSFSFSSSGTRLPIPVSLKVTQAQYKDVLDKIQVQIGYRAAIIVDNARRNVELQYNSPGLQGSESTRVIRPNSTGMFVPQPSRPDAPVKQKIFNKKRNSVTHKPAGKKVFNNTTVN